MTVTKILGMVISEKPPKEKEGVAVNYCGNFLLSTTYTGIPMSEWKWLRGMICLKPSEAKNYVLIPKRITYDILNNSEGNNATIEVYRVTYPEE
jgi:hypothetical protein